MTNKTLQARRKQADLPPIQRTESDFSTIIYILIMFLAMCFAGCSSSNNLNGRVSRKAACAGNRQMMVSQGYSKHFKF